MFTKLLEIELIEALKKIAEQLIKMTETLELLKRRIDVIEIRTRGDINS